MDLDADVNQYLDWQVENPLDEPIRLRSLTEIMMRRDINHEARDNLHR
jgi:hypothetical protein